MKNSPKKLVNRFAEALSPTNEQPIDLSSIFSATNEPESTLNSSTVASSILGSPPAFISQNSSDSDSSPISPIASMNIDSPGSSPKYPTTDSDSSHSSLLPLPDATGFDDSVSSVTYSTSKNTPSPSTSKSPEEAAAKKAARAKVANGSTNTKYDAKTNSYVKTPGISDYGIETSHNNILEFIGLTLFRKMLELTNLQNLILIPSSVTIDENLVLRIGAIDGFKNLKDNKENTVGIASGQDININLILRLAFGDNDQVPHNLGRNADGILCSLDLGHAFYRKFDGASIKNLISKLIGIKFSVGQNQLSQVQNVINILNDPNNIAILVAELHKCIAHLSTVCPNEKLQKIQFIHQLDKEQAYFVSSWTELSAKLEDSLRANLESIKVLGAVQKITAAPPTPIAPTRSRSRYQLSSVTNNLASRFNQQINCTVAEPASRSSSGVMAAGVQDYKAPSQLLLEFAVPKPPVKPTRTKAVAPNLDIKTPRRSLTTTISKSNKESTPPATASYNNSSSGSAAANLLKPTALNLPFKTANSKTKGNKTPTASSASARSTLSLSAVETACGEAAAACVSPAKKDVSQALDVSCPSPILGTGVLSERTPMPSPNKRKAGAPIDSPNRIRLLSTAAAASYVTPISTPEATVPPQIASSLLDAQACTNVSRALSFDF